MIDEETLKKWAEKKDTLTEGSLAFIEELEALLAEAKAGEFDDFANEKYPTPKMTLRNKLLSMANNVINGNYD